MLRILKILARAGQKIDRITSRLRLRLLIFIDLETFFNYLELEIISSYLLVGLK